MKTKTSYPNFEYDKETGAMHVYFSKNGSSYAQTNVDGISEAMVLYYGKTERKPKLSIQKVLLQAIAADAPVENPSEVFTPHKFFGITLFERADFPKELKLRWRVVKENNRKYRKYFAADVGKDRYMVFLFNKKDCFSDFKGGNDAIEKLKATGNLKESDEKILHKLLVDCFA